MPDDLLSTDEQSEEELKKQKEEEEQKENEEDEEEFHLHMGKIMGINGFTHISSLSWDKAYDNPTGTSKIELHYPKDNLKDMIKYVYKGVSCKAKLRRSTDKEFKTTYIEEIGLDEDGIKSREHYPTKEQREEIELEVGYDELVNNVDKTTAEKAEETLPKTRSDSDAGIYGFVTDVSHSQKGTELEVKDWGFALEDKTKKLSFSSMTRSQILEEVIKTYGLVPIVDFTGLRNDVISWSNVTGGGSSSSNENNTTNLSQSSEWDDTTTSHDLSGYDTRTVYYAGNIPPEDPKYYETIHDPNANYTKFVQGCTTPEQVMQKLRPLAKYCSYADNRDASAKTSFNNISSPGLNCGDSARLVKCCMDSCGIPCIVIHVAHVETAPYGHYYNAVKKNGKWYTTDLCRVNETIKNRTMTQTLGV